MVDSCTPKRSTLFLPSFEGCLLLFSLLLIDYNFCTFLERWTMYQPPWLIWRSCTPLRMLTDQLFSNSWIKYKKCLSNSRWLEKNFYQNCNIFYVNKSWCGGKIDWLQTFLHSWQMILTQPIYRRREVKVLEEL